MSDESTKSSTIELDSAAVDQLVGWRRHLHAHPELSNQEEKTAQFIEARLSDMGLSRVQRVADTGVVATVDGDHYGPTLAWRADIDALPIQEANDHDYRSQTAGVMHACGHDVHTTVGLGLAEQMWANRGRLCGRIKFIFQPAEEASPTGEPVGAEKMAQAGVLDNPEVDAVFAAHCMPALAANTIGYTGGPVWAGSDLVEIDIDGRQAHGAYPHEGVDAVAVASQLVSALQTVVSRRIDARKACVVTIGRIEAGQSYNILAEKAHLTGILRALDPAVADQAKAEIGRLTKHICAGFDAAGHVEFTPGARPVINDAGLESVAVAALLDRFGDDEIVKHRPQLGAEDFAAFSRRRPGCYLFLGIRNESKGITDALHTPGFDVDERCLTFGVERFGAMLLDVARARQATPDDQ